MDLFALPYKAVVLRLVESGVITEEEGQKSLSRKSESIAIRIELTGKAEQWQQNSGSLLRYGSLLDNLAFNSEHELLVDSRGMMGILGKNRKGISESKIRSVYGK